MTRETDTHLTALYLGLPGWAGTRKVKPIWILLKQETVSGSGISWAIRKSAPRSRQITTPSTHHSVFYRPDALPAAQPTACVYLVKSANPTRQRSIIQVGVGWESAAALLSSSSPQHQHQPPFPAPAAHPAWVAFPRWRRQRPPSFALSASTVHIND